MATAIHGPDGEIHVNYNQLAKVGRPPGRRATTETSARKRPPPVSHQAAAAVGGGLHGGAVPSAADRCAIAMTARLPQTGTVQGGVPPVDGARRSPPPSSPPSTSPPCGGPAQQKRSPPPSRRRRFDVEDGGPSAPVCRRRCTGGGGGGGDDGGTAAVSPAQLPELPHQHHKQAYFNAILTKREGAQPRQQRLPPPPRSTHVATPPLMQSPYSPHRGPAPTPP